MKTLNEKRTHASGIPYIITDIAHFLDVVNATLIFIITKHKSVTWKIHSASLMWSDKTEGYKIHIGVSALWTKRMKSFLIKLLLIKGVTVKPYFKLSLITVNNITAKLQTFYFYFISHSFIIFFLRVCLDISNKASGLFFMQIKYEWRMFIFSSYVLPLALFYIL